ncbi:hypothetical protein C2G38_2174527 [Gigaspora rosea]|uniref:Protein kinase domain-containing protein n=1 Tax=Gigaspora rosea TaxID=44941 RepID=A0A397VIC0_9GLOM|nr:hypothetical protein C2G38_2174527 [Gigaspora rosea]
MCIIFSILIAPKEITVEIIKKLIKIFDQLPHKSALKNFLSGNPPVKIPLAPNHFYQISTTDLSAITEEERDTGIRQNFKQWFEQMEPLLSLGMRLTKKFANEDRVTHLKEIYEILSANNVGFSDKLEHSSTHSVTLVPRGEQHEPNDLKELLQALICTLTYLKGMHESKLKPIMHKDIRWPNVIHHYDEYQRFILIDFDYATYSPSDEPLYEFSKSDHAPEMLTKEHNFKV